MEEQTIIIGAGPCGLACALELRRYGIDPLIIEKGNIVQTIYEFPTHQTFFSSSEHLEIGEIPFVCAKPKPVRNDALAYYREVVKRNELRIHPYETVTQIIKKTDELFEVTSVNINTEKRYVTKNVIIATGYYDQPKWMDVTGENLPHVMHYFKEAHPYYDMNVVVIGGKNSAVDTALELNRAGAHVTVLYRGKQYSSSIKPWILPAFDSLVRREKIKMEFSAFVTEITDTDLIYEVNEKQKRINADYVFAMTGYQPDITFLQKVGVDINNVTGRPIINQQTYETNIPNMYVAGVVIAGYNGNEIFIENGRLHSECIAKSINNNK